MKFFLLPLLAMLSAGLRPAVAQTVQPVGAVSVSDNAQYVMRNGAVVLHQNNNFQGLTQNIRLANGTKINYKSGIVELPGGKITTLHEGDYVKANGDIVFATPASAATARGDSAPAPTARYQPYVQRAPSPAEVEQQLAHMNQQISLMAQKIQLLNQKISLLSNAANAPATRRLDEQIRDLDEQLRQMK